MNKHTTKLKNGIVTIININKNDNEQFSKYTNKNAYAKIKS